jgi:hypothetical protein
MGHHLNAPIVRWMLMSEDVRTQSGRRAGMLADGETDKADKSYTTYRAVPGDFHAWSADMPGSGSAGKCDHGSDG